MVSIASGGTKVFKSKNAELQDGILQHLSPAFHFKPLISLCPAAQDMENISEDDGWEFVNLGDQQSFGIKTAGLEEKATACQMLVSDLSRTMWHKLTWLTLIRGPDASPSSSSPQVCYAKELKEGFVEYTEQVVKLMVPLLKFYFHDDILSGPNAPVERLCVVLPLSCPV